LNDLDVRASDLLQSNGIIWVEGPSDRIYINSWIDLWSERRIKEGLHYQCVFYGGRLLSHLSATDDIDASGIQLFRVNRNALILMDSDRKQDDSDINKTKTRIVNEIKSIGGISWVTSGREIENYIPLEAFNNAFGLSCSIPPDKKSSFFDFINNQNTGIKKWEQKKALLAEKIVPHLTKDNIRVMNDLGKKLEVVCGAINKWNGGRLLD
jgi:hypothetical protein